MNTTSVPAMKPVLVEKITDDISTLQSSDVEKQKNMFSARAIADIFKCPIISKDNPSDSGFYDGDTIDLNKVTESGHRTLLADSYKNGPDVYVDQVAKGTVRIWSVNHSQKKVVPTSYLYTYGVLPTGELEWTGNYDGKISIEDDETKQTIKERTKSSTIRQILYPNLDNEYFVKRPQNSRWDCGTPFCRQGTLQSDGTYVWEDWYLMGKSHNGPEYFTQINITGDHGEDDPIEALSVDATYHIYGTVACFRLPNANYDGYKPGMKIVVCVHPPFDSNAVSACNVMYRDTNADGSVPADDEMTLLLTPHFRRDTKELDASIAVDSLITSTTTFEIVDVRDATGNNTYRSWSVEASDEETDFTSGMAQLLGEHIDRGTGDIVNFNRSEIASLKTIKITRAVTNCGYVLARFLNSLADPVFTDVTWTASVRAINIDSGAIFVKETATTPQEQNVYYTKSASGKYSLVGVDGHPESFVTGVDYYYLDLTNSNYIDVTQIADSATTYRNSLYLSDLEIGVPRMFTAFINRNDVIVIEITSTNYRIEEYCDRLVPQVFFFPDPHDSYIHKFNVNPRAFTAYQLNSILAKGEMVPMSEQHALDAPASTRALLNAYLYLASNLQAKGLLHGNVEYTSHDDKALNRLVTPGFHWVTPKSVDSSGNPVTPAWVIDDTTSWPPCAVMDVGMHLMCLTSAYSHDNLIHKDEGEITEALQCVQIALAPPTDDSVIPLLYVRRGTRDDVTSNDWTWTPWISFFEDIEWERIVHKPTFFRARWDYFMDPNALIDRIDAVTESFIEVSGSYVNVGCKITAEEIQAFMAKNTTDPERDETINFKIPTFMIGRKNLAVRSDWESYKTEHGCLGIDYVIDVELPQATESQLSKEIAKVDDRRKIMFMFYGSPSIGDFHKLILKAHYTNSSETKSYYYNLTWNGEFESILQIEFDQIDLPKNEDTTLGDRIWAPLEAL